MCARYPTPFFPCAKYGRGSANKKSFARPTLFLQGLFSFLISLSLFFAHSIFLRFSSFMFYSNLTICSKQAHFTSSAHNLFLLYLFKAFFALSLPNLTPLPKASQGPQTFFLLLFMTKKWVSLSGTSVLHTDHIIMNPYFLILAGGIEKETGL